MSLLILHRVAMGPVSRFPLQVWYRTLFPRLHSPANSWRSPEIFGGSCKNKAGGPSSSMAEFLLEIPEIAIESLDKYIYIYIYIYVYVCISLYLSLSLYIYIYICMNKQFPNHTFFADPVCHDRIRKLSSCGSPARPYDNLPYDDNTCHNHNDNDDNDNDNNDNIPALNNDNTNSDK